MSDDDRIRSLLTIAADLPDDVQAPVTSLLARARQRRRLRAAVSVAGAAVIVAAAVTLPVVLRSLGTGPAKIHTPPGVVPGPPVKPTGPTAAQLARFRWSSLPPSPLGRRSQPLLTWTGRYLIELGGYQRGQYVPQDGASYDAATHRWRRIAQVPRGLDLASGITTWTGRQLFVANSQSLPYWTVDRRGTAALYDPATNRWTVIGLPPKLLGDTQLSAASTGGTIIVAAVGSARRAPLAVAAFDPAAGRWTMITPRLPANHPPVAAAMVATPGRLLLWSLWSKSTKTSKNGYAVKSGVDVLSLGRSGWTTVTGNWPQHQTVDDPAYAGGSIFLGPSQIWCGLCSHPFVEYRSRLVDPATLTIMQIPAGPLANHPLVQADLWLWTGRVAIAMNLTGQNSQSQHISQLAVYDPPTHSWHLLPDPPRDQVSPSPVWAGRQLLVLTSTGALWALHR